jgi:hypothetical protein
MEIPKTNDFKLPAMKINFATALTIVFVTWALGLFYLVYRSSGESVDLVARDYYNQEIAYQNKIDKETNAGKLSESVEVEMENQSQQLRIRFPQEFHSRLLSGQIHFFKPDDASADFTVALQTDETGLQRVSTNEIKSGFWRVKIDWACDGVSYFAEKTFHLP